MTGLTISPTLKPALGGYYRGTPPGRQPTWFTQIEVSGYAWTPTGWRPFNRARLNPAETRMVGRCTCPMTWTL